MEYIGITEQGDAALDNSWKKWVYEHNRPAILITKNPKRLIEHNEDLFFGNNLKGNVILHATITGLGGSKLEPNVPYCYEQLDYLQKMIYSNYGFHKERIVIRQDPIIPALAIASERYRTDTYEIAKFAVDNGLRYRMSFFDLYPHVRARLESLKQESIKILEKNKGLACIDNTDFETPFIKDIEYLFKLQPEMHLPLETRLEFLELLKKNTGLTDEMIEICGEPGLKCTGCLSKRDLDTFGIELDKDPETGFQRPACACLGLKKELLSNKHPCGHKCAYCYWKD